MMPLTRSSAPLCDVLYELSLAKDIPDPELLDQFVRRYPEYAEDLTEFAIELVIERRHRDKIVEPVADPTTVSPAVSRAMSKYQNALFTNRVAKPAAAALRAKGVTPAAVNPFASLDRQGFRKLAHDLNANTLFLSKLRDRLVEYATFTPGFLRHLADKMGCALESLAAHFAADQAPVLQKQFCKAAAKPVTGLKQTFEEAVRSSGLSDEQQRDFLSL